MIVSLNWLKQFVDIDISIDELKELIGARLVEVEDVEYLGEKYKDVLIVKVVSAEKIEGSDHLSLVKIDDGLKCTNVDRDEDGFIQVVCGAPNIKTGQTVAWLPPESIVPETFDDVEPFKLSTINLRGKISNGMIASPKELALFDEHKGILEIEDDLLPGTLFAAYLELDDYLLNIENKSLTHRPDCFGVVGFAREIAVITGKKFKTPEWLMDLSKDFVLENPEIEIEINIEDSELCPRYLATAMVAVDASIKSPLKIQSLLARVGVKPINAVVDVTNYLMMLTGQPLHAFDYDKVLQLNNGKPQISVRAGAQGEKLELLGGKVIDVSTSDIVIATGKTTIGLAGAMGGANSEIDENTKRVIIESASFNLFNLRSTQMRHGIFSEAITRFTKGQSPELSKPVMMMAIKLMSDWVGAIQTSNVSDSYPKKLVQEKITIKVSDINDVLGSDFSDSAIISTLKNAEFLTETTGEKVTVQAPYWRSDIHIAEDVVEEVGRLNGFDNIIPTLPKRDFTAIYQHEFDEFRKMMKKALVRAGANEVLTYSFTHGDVIDKSLQDTDNSYKLVNSISPDLQYFRQTLTPSLLGLINMNIKQGFDEFMLFEFNKVHQKKHGLNEESVPNEDDVLAAVYASKTSKTGAPYYQVKNILNLVLELIGIELDYVDLNDVRTDNALVSVFETKRTAALIDRSRGKVIGYVGEYKKAVSRSFKLPQYCAGFEIDTRLLFECYKNYDKKYKPISRFPAIERDICFQLSKDVNYSKIIKPIQLLLKSVPYETEISPVDIYSANNSDIKNVTVRIKMTSHDHTLTNKEANDIVDSIESVVVVETSAQIV
jgi:phenylalanyl-tRNA synthetase beta chain